MKCFGTSGKILEHINDGYMDQIHFCIQFAGSCLSLKESSNVYCPRFMICRHMSNGQHFVSLL